MIFQAQLVLLVTFKYLIIQILLMRGRISVTVEKGVVDAWKEYCEAECINASKLVGRLIKDHLTEKGRLSNVILACCAVHEVALPPGCDRSC